MPSVLKTCSPSTFIKPFCQGNGREFIGPLTQTPIPPSAFLQFLSQYRKQKWGQRKCQGSARSWLDQQWESLFMWVSEHNELSVKKIATMIISAQNCSQKIHGHHISGPTIQLYVAITSMLRFLRTRCKFSADQWETQIHWFTPDHCNPSHASSGTYPCHLLMGLELGNSLSVLSTFLPYLLSFMMHFLVSIHVLVLNATEITNCQDVRKRFPNSCSCFPLSNCNSFLQVS